MLCFWRGAAIGDFSESTAVSHFHGFSTLLPRTRPFLPLLILQVNNDNSAPRLVRIDGADSLVLFSESDYVL